MPRIWSKIIHAAMAATTPSKDITIAAGAAVIFFWPKIWSANAAPPDKIPAYKISEISVKIEYNFLDYFYEVSKLDFTPYLFFGIGATILKNVEERKNVLDNNELFINIPFGLGFKYLINKRFSLAFELEIKKTFNDNLDYMSGANTKNINSITGLNFNNSIKNFQYGSGNDNDFYYFTGISISYIFYRIPCPKNSAPYNGIY